MRVISKIPRKLKKECKKVVLRYTMNKSKRIRITNFNKETQTFEYRIDR